MEFVDIELADQGLIRSALSAYDLGVIESVCFHSGTAARSWRVSSRNGDVLLRTRGVRTSADALVRFDHALRRHLLAHGIPTAAPLATRDGQSVVRVGERVLEVYPLLAGECAAHLDDSQVVAAADLLARFHQASQSFPLAQSLPPVSQYRTLGVADARQRMEDPVLLGQIYAGLAQEPGAAAYAPAVRCAERWLARLQEEFNDAVYADLPQTVTHGDYTPANLLFVGSEVAGVFDFDWARWAPRVRDIADGLFFVSGTRRTPLVPGDIWSLTEPVTLSAERVLLWLRQYQSLGALTARELAILPLALAARWLSVRVEGTAKVAPEARLRFAFASLPAPLDWLESEWPGVAAVCLRQTNG